MLNIIWILNPILGFPSAVGWKQEQNLKIPSVVLYGFLDLLKHDPSCIDLAVKHQLTRPLDKTVLDCEIKTIFLISHPIHVMGTLKNRLTETVLWAPKTNVQNER